MRAFLQRVNFASVTADGVPCGEIGFGLLILLGVRVGDNNKNAEKLAAKVAKLRIFNDTAGKMNLDINQVGGQALVVSNFTLYADSSHGNRPNYMNSAPPDSARELYEYFIAQLSKYVDMPIQRGVFGAHMEISTVCNGPVSIMLEAETEV